MKDLTRSTGGRINKNDLFKNLERRNIHRGQIESSLVELNNSGYLFEEDDIYTLQL